MMDDIVREATASAIQQSTANKAPVALTDRGIHRTQVDVWEEELIAAGWKPHAQHPNSPTWIAPNGEKHPGPGWAHAVMTKQKEQEKL